MSSKNSYTYYSRFLRCVCRKYKYKEPDFRQYWRDDYRNSPMRAIIDLFDYLIEVAPSACLGADDWLDKFFNKADGALCTGMWCGDEHCDKHNGGYPYNCSGGCIPSKCKIWKDWRRQWRSYPEKEECKKCRYYKPDKPWEGRLHDASYVKSIAKTNEYKCYCRAKELPDGCPKKKKRQTEIADVCREEIEQ